MPRDTLVLDVELDPARLAQARDAYRAAISQNLTTGFGVGGYSTGHDGSPVIGGPYGGVSGSVPYYAPSNIFSNFSQAMFPGGYAPLNVPTDEFGFAMQNKFNQRVTSGLLDTAATGTDMAAGMTGAHFGGKIGTGIGTMVGTYLGGPAGGRAGAWVGWAAGELAGAVVGEGISSAVTSPIRQVTQNVFGMQTTLQQEGFKTGLGNFLNESGSSDSLKLAAKLRDIVANDDLIQATGTDAGQFAQNLLQKGLRGNLFGFINREELTSGLSTEEEKTDKIKEIVEERYKTVLEQTKKVMLVFRSSQDDALQILTQLRQQGFTNETDINQQVNILNTARNKFQMDPMELLQASSAGAQLARSQGLDPVFGSTQTEMEILNIHRSRGNQYVDRSVAIQGSEKGVALALQQATQGELQTGGVIDAIMRMSMNPQGELDIEKFKEFSNKNITRAELNKLVGESRATGIIASGGDQFAYEAQFQFMKPQAMDQIRQADPTSLNRIMMKEVDTLAENRYPGAPVNDAIRAQIAQIRFNMPEDVAKAWVKETKTTQEEFEKAINDGSAAIQKDRQQKIQSLKGRFNTFSSTISNFFTGIVESTAIGIEEGLEGAESFIKHPLDFLKKMPGKMAESTQMGQFIKQVEQDKAAQAAQLQKTITAEEKKIKTGDNAVLTENQKQTKQLTALVGNNVADSVKYLHNNSQAPFTDAQKSNKGSVVTGFSIGKNF